MKTKSAVATPSLISIHSIILLVVLTFGTATVQANNLFWNTTNGIWDIKITANWTGDATLFTNGDNVNFTNTVGGIITNNTAGVAPGSIAISAASGTYAITGGPIGGSGGLTMSGGGTLTLASTNTYTGVTTISSGIVSVSAPAALGAIGVGNGTTVGSAAQLQIATGSSGLAEPITINGTAQFSQGPLRFINTGLTTAGAITLGSDAKITGANASTMSGPINLASFTLNTAWNNSSTETISGIISGTGGLTQVGGGSASILVLTATNTYTGPTTLTAGELSVSTTNNLGAPAANLVFNGGMLQITGTALTNLAGLGHAVSFSGAVGLDISNSANTFTADQALTQSGGLTKSGAGTLVLNQANTYTGVTTVNGGKLRLAGGTGNAIPSGGSAVTLAGGTLDMNGQVQTIYNLQTGGTATTNVLTDSSGGGVLTTVYNSTGILVATNNTLIINGGTLNQGSGVTGQYNNSGTLTIAGGTLNVPNELLNGFNNANAVVNLNSGVINVSSMSFGNSACTYRLNGGTVQCDNFKRRSTGAVDLFFNGVTVQTRSTTFGNFLPTAAFTAGQNAWISTGGATFDSTNKSITISCALQHDTLGSATDGGLTKTGSGTLTLSATNTYNGTTLVSAGMLTEAATGFIADTSPLTVNGSTTIFDLGASHSDTVGTVTLMNGSITGSGTSTLTVGAGTLAMQNGTVSAALAGVGIALNKTTAGTVTLSGTNTYSGATTISNGKLVGAVGGSCSNSAVAVAATSGNTAALGVSITANTLRWTCPSVIVNNAGTSSGLDFDFGAIAPSTTVAPLQVTGAATFTTTPTVTVELLAANVTVGVVYPLMTWGSTSGTAPTLVTVSAAGRSSVTGHLTVVGSTLNLVIDTSASTEPLSWTGGNGTWDLNNSGNLVWKDSVSATTYFQTGDTVVFDNTVGSGGTVTLNTNLSPVSVTVNNSSADYTFSGSGGIAGAIALTKSGAAALTLTTSNSYSGGTVINTGTVTLGNGGTTGDLGTGSISNNTALIVNRSDTPNFTQIISGPGALTMAGSGTLTLSGANTYSGTTTISSGTLGINVASTQSAGTILSGATGVGNVTLTNGVTLFNQLNPNPWYVPTLTLLGDITLTGNQRQQVGFYKLDLTGGTRTLHVNPTGGLVIQAITGNTALEGTGRNRWEMIDISDTHAFTNNSGTLTITNGTLALDSNQTGNNYAAFMIQFPSLFGGNAGLTVGTNVYFQTVVAYALGTNSTDSAKLTVNGIWNLNGSVLNSAIPNGDQTIYSLTGSGQVYAAMSVAGTNARTITINGTTGSTDFSGSLNNGPGTGALSLIKNGASTQILSGTNTYTGNTAVSAGTLMVNGSLGTSAVTVSGGSLGGSGIIGGPVTVQSGGTLAPGGALNTLTINSNLTLVGNLLFNLNKSLTPSNNLVVVSGVLTNAGTGTLIVSNLGPALVVGDRFQLFSGAVSNGNALTIVSSAATWMNNLAVDGSIQVVSLDFGSAPNFPPGALTRLLDGNISLVATGAVGSTYRLWASTNVALTPVTNTWTPLVTNTIGASGSVTNYDLHATNFPQRFYLFTHP